MNITFIGAGYIGLVSSVALATLGHNVICLDVDKEKIQSLKKGVLPIYELGLSEALKQVVSTDNLIFKDSYKDLLEEANDSSVIFIATNTPSLPSGGADLSFIIKALDELIEHIKSETLIIIKSTVPPGTCLRLQAYINGKGYNHRIASNPEFLREGTALKDFFNPDRIVFGINNKCDRNILMDIYSMLLKRDIPLIVTDTTTAELIKYASNAFLANKIAFINEIADICEVIDADIGTISYGMGLDKRIGNSFLNVGPGYGGSCFPKDVRALRSLVNRLNINTSIMEAITESNNRRFSNIANKIEKILNGLDSQVTLTLLGYAFKAGTDDIRESPALEIAKLLLEKGAKIKAYDPKAKSPIEYLANFKDFQVFNEAMDAIADSHALIIATEWKEFKEYNFKLIRQIVKTPVIIDLRNILYHFNLHELGFDYYPIGKAKRNVTDSSLSL